MKTAEPVIICICLILSIAFGIELQELVRQEDSNESPEDKSLVVEVPLGSRSAVFNFSDDLMIDDRNLSNDDRSSMKEQKGGNSGGNDGANDRDGKIIDISEKRFCYVYGQCQDHSVDFKSTVDAEHCHKFCGRTADCKYWSWEPELTLCVLHSHCSESGQPEIDPCPTCISGQRLCPARDCHGGFKCKGKFVDSYLKEHLEECIMACKDHEDCHYYSYEKAGDFCVLYETCSEKTDCEACASGVGACSRGYHGDR